MAILRIRDENGEVQEILALKGDKGDKGTDGTDGTVSFDELTDAQKASLKGEKGDKGDTGPKGDKGDTGAQGIQGEKGEKGDAGIVPDDYGNDKFANALTATKEGTVVRLDDVSPLSTVVSVKAEGAEPHRAVLSYGKNLFDFKSGAGQIAYSSSGGSASGNGYKVELPAGTYTFHAEKLVQSSEHFLFCYINDRTGAYISNHRLIYGPDAQSFTVTLNAGDVVYVKDSTAGNGDLNVVNQHFNNEWNIQVEYGVTATPYEPYDERTFEVLEDGVAQVELLRPTTTLMHSDGVSLSAKYNRDTNGVVKNLEQTIERLEKMIVSLGGVL